MLLLFRLKIISHTVVHAMGLIVAASIPCFLLLLFLLLIPRSQQAVDTIVVDAGLAEWKAPTLHVGDSLVFKHKHLRNLYLFDNRRAFDLCNFDQSTLIYGGKSSHFQWRPSRPGYYYVATRDDSSTSSSQRRCEKVPVRVVVAHPDPSPEGGLPSFPAAAPPPAAMSGGADIISSSPSNTWSTYSSSSSSGPSPEPVASRPLEPKERLAPAAAPWSSSTSGTLGSVPFISSSPAVPLPVGETDTATILPFPTPGSDSQQVVVALASSCVAVPIMSLLLLLLLLPPLT